MKKYGAKEHFVLEHFLLLQLFSKREKKRSVSEALEVSMKIYLKKKKKQTDDDANKTQSNKKVFFFNTHIHSNRKTNRLFAERRKKQFSLKISRLK